MPARRSLQLNSGCFKSSDTVKYTRLKVYKNVIIKYQIQVLWPPDLRGHSWFILQFKSGGGIGVNTTMVIQMYRLLIINGKTIKKKTLPGPPLKT